MVERNEPDEVVGLHEGVEAGARLHVPDPRLQTTATEESSPAVPQIRKQLVDGEPLGWKR